MKSFNFSFILSLSKDPFGRLFSGMELILRQAQDDGWLKTKLGCVISIVALLLAFSTPIQADVVDDFHQVQTELDSSILDTYDGTASPQTEQSLAQAWQVLKLDITDPTASALIPTDFSSKSPEELAAKIGTSRALLQQIAALEMLAHQRAGNVLAAQTWRDMVTLPKFGNADDGGLLLQQSPEQVRRTEVTQTLAKEYVGWQVTRTRQLLDALQHTMAAGEATDAYVQAKLAEIQALSQFPKPLLQAAGVTNIAPTRFSLPVVVAPLDSPAALTAIAAWRDKIETTLPNLLSTTDVTRLQRLLARFIDVIPKEYRNGVQDSKVVIPLEYKEAIQFTEQAQSLINELAPVWRRDQHDAFVKYHGPVIDKLATLHKQIDQVRDLSVIQGTAGDIGSILENRFGLSARRAGQGGQIIEETALDVRTSLNDSLAAAKAGHWQQAESLRLDAYTAFDSEIEIRVMPRNPTLATHTERSFLDGQEEPGIKALLDSGANIDELTAGYARALKNLDECVALLKVSVSPATIAFTTFTILAREGLEAIVILAALLAGLRGAENTRIRHGIVKGALLGVVASGITFWLSQTIIQSLVRFGEKLEAVVSVLAVIILFIVTNWVFHKMYWVGWNAKLRDLSKSAKAVRAPFWEISALLGVGFLTVYREGFETTIFMQSLMLEGSTSAVLLGVMAGFAFIGTIGMLIMFFGAKLPYRKMLIVTGLLVVSIMVTFMGSGVRLFQTVGWLPVHPLPGFNFPNWVGVWLGIYPSWEGLLIPPLALVYVGGAWLYTKLAAARAQAKAAPVPPPIQASTPRPKTPVSV
jgi:high-affinity iron transporter